MKKIFATVLISTSLAMSLSTAIANYPCPPNDAYCLYIDDPSNSQHWFRVTALETGKPSQVSQIVCLGSIEQAQRFTLYEIWKRDIERKSAQVEGAVYICKSGSAEDSCVKLKDGDFSTSCAAGDNACDPYSQSITLTPEEKNFPECDGTKLSNKLHLAQ